MKIKRRYDKVKLPKFSAKGLHLGLVQNVITTQRKISDGDLPFNCAYVLVEFRRKALGQTLSNFTMSFLLFISMFVSLFFLFLILTLVPF